MIAGNADDIHVTGAGANDNKIQGNRLSLNATGTSLIAPSAGYGIFVASGASRTKIGTDSDGINDATEGNQIGMASTAAIFLQDLSGVPDATIIAGNQIGLSATGRLLSTGARGIWLAGASNTRIGSNADGISDVEERNVIVPGVSGTGILVSDGYVGSTNGTTIAGNFIGLNASGTAGLSPNTAIAGVSIQATGFAVTGTVIGGTSATARNVIGSMGSGVTIVDTLATILKSSATSSEQMPQVEKPSEIALVCLYPVMPTTT